MEFRLPFPPPPDPPQLQSLQAIWNNTGETLAKQDQIIALLAEIRDLLKAARSPLG